MKIDGVFSGGGIKAYAYIGALDAMEENGFSLERVAGTSAGAIVAALLAAGFETEEIKKEIQNTDFQVLLDSPKWSKFVPFSKWVRIYFKMGMYKGDALENWLFHLFAKKNVYTFADVANDYLKVIVSDISLKKMIVIPDDLERVYGIDPETFPIATAVRMSASFPYLFMPKNLTYHSYKHSLIVDGGLLSNFPLWLFEHRKKAQRRPVLGVRLSGESDYDNVKSITNALEMFQGLFSTMKLAHDTRYVSVEEKKNIIYIPVEDVGATDLTRSQVQNDQLIKTGYDMTSKFLMNWPR